ncbi:hypothetical protein ACIPSJ_40735 [Streptomyces sp. NPDC090088]|uniref:hypothetical protein n=1 Tax=Streptomyces sp. NPDC090088 TaxID=3365944 RepID=UPI00381CC7BB
MHGLHFGHEQHSIDAYAGTGFYFGMAQDVRTRILEVLNGQSVGALFLTELDARLTGTGSEEVARAVLEMENDRILVVDRPSPDPHVIADLRIVALIDPADPDAARRSAESVWSRWVKEVLSHHRCG